MRDEPLEVIRGSGNVYRDLEISDPDIRQLKAILAAEVIKRLDKEGLSVRKAHSLTGIDAGDFSRVRNANFRRISIERLVVMANRLGSRVEIRIKPNRSNPIRHEARPWQKGVLGFEIRKTLQNRSGD